MGNARFVEDLSHRDKAMATIETYGAGLGLQPGVEMTLVIGDLQQSFEDETPYTLSSPGRQHGHTPDLAAWQESPGAYRLP